MKSIFFICLLFIASLFIGNIFANDSIKADDITCEMCNFAIQYAQQYITTNATEQEIVQKLEDVCNGLPEKYAQTCDETINNYGVLIIRLLINKEDPKNICEMLELCSKSSSESLLKENDDLVGNTQSSPLASECKICETVVDYAQKYAEEGSENVKTDLLGLCKLVFGFIPSLGQQCETLVEENFDAIIEALQNNFDASSVCQNVLHTQYIYFIKNKSFYSTTPTINDINITIENDEEIKKKNRLIVKDLYKQLLYLGRVGFLGVDYIRDRAKPQFFANANLTDNNKINECIERTKYVIKEIEAMNRFHKYRNLKKSYDLEFQKINDDFLNFNTNKNK
ncbi:hypothetical protein RB653_001179 [Dictyostelium firmibasis]|uniref:Saposin B-type domain-containing protein n=1 Tax=Dictyostelium firmibasis TaxID=79012 RepID=A0AAN7Z1V9_9MYCE